MEIRVFLQENSGFLGCGVSKKSQKTHENDVRNGCLRNVLKIDGILIKNELQNVAKTTQKTIFSGWILLENLMCFLSMFWYGNGAKMAPKRDPKLTPK